MGSGSLYNIDREGCTCRLPRGALEKMGGLSWDREKVLRLLIVAIASASAIFGTVFSLAHGVSAVFAFLYLLPIICAVYFYPKRAVLFTLGLSLVFIGLVYFLGGLDHTLIAISTAWFAIFVTLAVVASSYANGIVEEKARILSIMENTLDGICCIDPATLTIRTVNQKCAQALLFSRNELKGEPVDRILADTETLRRFMDEAREKKGRARCECLLRQKDGGLIRSVWTPLYIGKGAVLCSVVDMTNATVADEEIRQTLEDLERQVRERTARLEQMNEDLKKEIIERRRIGEVLLSKKDAGEPGKDGGIRP